MEKGENKPGNLKPSGQAEINGVLTKREQLITMKARQRDGDIHPGERVARSARLMPKRKCDYGNKRRLREREGSPQLRYISSTSDDSFALHSGLLFSSCPILSFPLSCLRNKRVSIAGLVGGADVTGLWSRNSPGEGGGGGSKPGRAAQKTDGILGDSLLLWRSMAH